MIGYSVGLIGMWILADGVASLYTYTHGKKARGQSWLRDHSFRLVRCLLGIVLMYLGAMVN